MTLSKEKESELLLRMEKLGIKEEDLIEKFILGSGSGGQKINKTSSCVYLKHIPTGIEVKCQRDRSRTMNRFLARRELCEKLESQRFEEKSQKQKAIEKIRRQKRRRSRKSKEKMLADKQKHSEKKSLRRPP
ncbi:MAG TPA: peptide chain release factor-like protein [Chlamydiales bacterium]|jgi:protein subunit release factor B|nr:peptide chain release factor-like protein [Chlamydiales bacterium]